MTKKIKKLATTYTRRIRISNDENSINSGIDKETIVKKKFDQFATYTKNGVKYTIFENKIDGSIQKQPFNENQKNNYNYYLIAKKQQKTGTKNYFLNCFKKYDIVQEVETIVKISEIDNKKIDKNYLENFLKKFIDRIESPELKFYDYLKTTFGVRHDN